MRTRRTLRISTRLAGVRTLRTRYEMRGQDGGALVARLGKTWRRSILRRDGSLQVVAFAFILTHARPQVKVQATASPCFSYNLEMFSPLSPSRCHARFLQSNDTSRSNSANFFASFSFFFRHTSFSSWNKKHSQCVYPCHLTLEDVSSTKR